MGEYIKPGSPELTDQEILEIHRRESKLKRKSKNDLGYVRLAVRSDNHTSSELTELFGIEPQDLMDDGDVIFESNRYLIYNTGGYWVLNSKDEVRSRLLEDHLEWVLEKLYDKRDLIFKLQAQGAEMGLRIHSQPASGVASCQIDRKTMKRLAQLNVELDFTVICRGTV